MISDIQKILAFDTAMMGCSVAVLDTETGNTVSDIRDMERGQAEALVPMIQELLQKAHTAFHQLDLIAVTIGPGAFTGVRIGLSTALAFGVSLGKPVIGLTTLEVLAARYFEENKPGDNEQLYVLIETKRKDFYMQIFSSDALPVTEPQAATYEEIADNMQGSHDIVLIGDACERFLAACSKDNVRFVEGYNLPDPSVMAAMALQKYEISSVISPEPLYLREADVSRPKKSGRVLAG